MTGLIANWFATGLLFWFAALALLITIRALRGDIGVTGLLRHGKGDSGVAPERVVAMVAFPVIIVSYAITALHTDVSVPQPTLPDVSEKLVNLLIGSNGLYLAGKIARN